MPVRLDQARYFDCRAVSASNACRSLSPLLRSSRDSLLSSSLSCFSRFDVSRICECALRNRLDSSVSSSRLSCRDVSRGIVGAIVT